MRYVDDLFDAWRAQGAQSRPAFKPDRSVLVVVAIETRQVALLAGPTLRN